MGFNRSYSRAEVQELLEAAAKEEVADEQFTATEVRAAAEAAGIDAGRLSAAARTLATKDPAARGLTALVGVSLLLGAGVVFVPGAFGSATAVLPLHNEHGDRTFDVEVLLPSVSSGRCAQSPELRFEPAQYCSWRTVSLGGNARLNVGLPASECGQVWIRVHEDGRPIDSRVFRMPASIEIEDGGLDQKGLGAPNMFPAPRGPENAAIVRCKGGLK